MDAIKIIEAGSVQKELPEFKIGDTVKVMETRPLSKDKRWRLVSIIEKAK